ncbi:hypothetical protein EV126DRAFT_15503 [Verticillium dahliae]|nr:hypothetical protein EV126DRAFT_15503 [Verticillium dahliae]
MVTPHIKAPRKSTRWHQHVIIREHRVRDPRTRFSAEKQAIALCIRYPWVVYSICWVAMLLLGTSCLECCRLLNPHLTIRLDTLDVLVCLKGNNSVVVKFDTEAKPLIRLYSCVIVPPWLLACSFALRVTVSK